MRLMTRVLGIGLSVVALSVVGVALWIFVYSRDLPDISAMRAFAPTQTVQVSDPCLPAASVAIPYESIGDNLRAALRAAEGSEEGPGFLTEMHHEITGNVISHKSPYSWLISRTMFCAPSKNLTRQTGEIRTAVQLERRFSRRELFTIFANRAWFGEGQVGVEAASQHFFQKEPNQLQAGESALLAGLIRAPAHLSPFTHPDRALKRRNEVIDAMVVEHAIDPKEGEIAKASALGVVARSVQ
jgi:penicillin-binding protein 1A